MSDSKTEQNAPRTSHNREQAEREPTTRLHHKVGVGHLPFCSAEHQQGHHFRKVKPTPWEFQHSASVARPSGSEHGLVIGKHHAPTHPVLLRKAPSGHHFCKVKPTPWGSQHPASVAAHLGPAWNDCWRTPRSNTAWRCRTRPV